MRTLLIILMIISWVVFVISVLMMSPKGWLGLGIWWMGNTSEYWSKKWLEGKLKNIAILAGLVFVITSLILPYTVS